MSLSSYDIYNNAIAQDLPFVTDIMTAFTTLLNDNVNNNVSKFDFDLGPFLPSDMEYVQQNRIIERVIYNIRITGISCQVKMTVVDDQMITQDHYTPYFMPYFNGLAAWGGRILAIRWYTRNASEYQKSFC